MIIVAYFSLSIWPTRIHSTEIETLGCALSHVWDRILLTLMMSEMYSLKVAELNYKLSEWDEKTHFWDPIYKRKWIFVPINDLVVVSKPRMIVDPSTTSKSQLKQILHCISALSYIFMSADMTWRTDVVYFPKITKMTEQERDFKSPVFGPLLGDYQSNLPRFGVPFWGLSDQAFNFSIFSTNMTHKHFRDLRHFHTFLVGP